MKVVASTEEYTIYLRRDGRHAIKSASKQAINGDDKVRLLLEHGLIEIPAPKAAEPEVVENTAETPAEADAEAPAEAADSEESDEAASAEGEEEK
ncbi:MAG: hypothetical protein P8L31_00685 [Pseudomonadales bacterium]|nr:hypothetical protein [Pseudomonadales bacterium]